MLKFRGFPHERVSDSDTSRSDIGRAAAGAASETMAGANGQANRSLLAVLAAAALSLSFISAPVFAAPPLEDGVCEYDNTAPKFFSINRFERRWAAVAVNPSGSDNKDIQLRRNFQQLQFTVATSSLPSGTDFVIGDFNHSPIRDYLPYVYGGNPVSNYKIQWDSGGEMTVGNPVSGTIAGYPECGLIRVWDLHLLADREYRFSLTQQGSSDVRLELFKNSGPTAYWASRQTGEFEISANGTPHVYSTFGYDDDYGVVVYEATPGMAAGSFTLVVDDVTPCTGVLESECYAYAGGGLPQCYKLPPGSDYWVGYAVAPEPGDSKDICVYTGINGTGGQLACSISSGTNFVVADYNDGQFGWAFPRVTGGSSSATYVAQREGGPEVMVVGEPLSGTLLGGSSGDCGLFQVYDLTLEAGRSYHFLTMGEPSVRTALFHNPGQGVYWAGRSDAEFEIGTGEHAYTAPTSGDYAVVVFTEDLSASDQSFVTMVIPRFHLAEDSCEGSTQGTMYSTSQTRNHWAAFAAKGSLAIDAAILLYGVPSILPGDALAGTEMQYSGFVVGDFNHNQTDEYYGLVFGSSQPYDHVADWDSGGILELGVPVHGSLGEAGSPCALIKMHDVALEEDRCYRITLSASAGIAARVALFENPTSGAYWAADQEALVDLAAGETPYIFTASRTDIFGVAVYDNSFGPVSGDYTLEVVQLDPDCISHVELSSFDASSTAESIELRWRSSLETDHLGFRLLRATAATVGGASGGDPFEPIGPELIGSSGDGHDYAYDDDDPTLEPGVTYLYRLEAIDRHGDVQAFGPLRVSLAGAPGAAGVTRLAAPQPNPFFERTELAYTLASPGPVELMIYDVGGRAVRALEQGFRPAGQHGAAWDGRNDDGAMLPSGAYFARLATGNAKHHVVRLLLVR